MIILTKDQCKALLATCQFGDTSNLVKILSLRHRLTDKYSKQAFQLHKLTKLVFRKALQVAAAYGHTHIVQLLLKDSRTQMFANYQEAFRVAVTWRNFEIVSLLMPHPKVNPAYNSNRALNSALNNGNDPIIRLLFSDPRVRNGLVPSKAVLWAVVHNEEELLGFLLSKDEIDPSWQKDAALCQACSIGDPRIVYKLLQHPKVNPGARKNLPLMLASRCGHKEVIDLLRVNSAVDLAAKDNLAVHLAAINNHSDVVLALLQHPEVDPSVRMNHETFMTAIHRGHAKVVKVLIDDNRIDASIEDNLPLRIAVLRNDIEIIKILLTYTVPRRDRAPKVNPNFSDDWAIYTAAGMGSIEQVKILYMDNSVNPGNQNNRALFNASRNGHAQVLRILLCHPKVVILNNSETQNLFNSTNDGSKGHAEVTRVLLKDGRIDPRMNDQRVFMTAVSKGFTLVVKAFLEDARIQPEANENLALYQAVSANHLDIVRLFLKDKRIDFGINEQRVLKCCINVAKSVEMTCLILENHQVDPMCSDFLKPTSAADIWAKNSLRVYQDYIARLQSCIHSLDIAQKAHQESSDSLNKIKAYKEEIQEQLDDILDLLAIRLVNYEKVIFFSNVPRPSVSEELQCVRIRRLSQDNGSLPVNVLHKIMVSFMDKKILGQSNLNKLEQLMSFHSEQVCDSNAILNFDSKTKGGLKL